MKTLEQELNELANCRGRRVSTKELRDVLARHAADKATGCDNGLDRFIRWMEETYRAEINMLSQSAYRVIYDNAKIMRDNTPATPPAQEPKEQEPLAVLADRKVWMIYQEFFSNRYNSWIVEIAEYPNGHPRQFMGGTFKEAEAAARKWLNEQPDKGEGK